MNLERLKTIILIILAVTSGYLTFHIWTYDPKYEKIEPGEYINIETDERTISDVIKPSKILIHRYQKHFQTSNSNDLEMTEKQLSDWDLYNFDESSSQMTKNEFTNFVHSNGTVEIVFLDEIPLSLYKTVLQIKDKEIPNFSFDRILYKQSDIQSQEGTIYFASSDRSTILKVHVLSKDLQVFDQTFYQNALTFPEYTAYFVNLQQPVFVSKNPLSLKRYCSSISYLEEENFKDALFNDPLNVRVEVVASGEEYSDSTSLMSVDVNTHMLSFINPSQKRKQISSSSDLLDKSIQFINNHAGWQEDDFQFAGIDEHNQSVTFRLFKEGYPLFNQLGMSEIREVWGDTEIYSYKRPYFTLDYVFPTENPEVVMPSGFNVMDKLKTLQNFDFSKVKDLTIGYEMSLDPSNEDLILLEPKWYYRSGENWTMVPFDKSGGQINGLE